MSEKASLEERVVEKLKEKGWQIVCAESCTGGMLASTLALFYLGTDRKA